MSGTGELPARTLAWAGSVAPDPVREVVPVGGGITRTKWRLQLHSGEVLVLRYADPIVWGETGREHVRREALGCRLLGGSELPVPELIATELDPAAGGPANLLTWRPGSARLDRLSESAVGALARVAVAIHARSVPVSQRPPGFSFRGAGEPQVPDWARWPTLWKQAITRFRTGPPATPYGLLHRDFHFGNTLWQGDAVTGVIDWAETSWGPPDLDVAHLCCDVAMMHRATDAAAFRAAYVGQGGRLDPDPDAARFWVISDILGFLPDPAHILPAVQPARPDLTAEKVRSGLEDLLALTLS